MKLRKALSLVVGVMILCSAAAMAQSRQLQPEHPGWPLAQNTEKPWVRWWWPGSGVDKESLTRQLEELARVGVGGVEITPIYGANGYEDRYIDFLSPKWVEMLEHVGQEGKRLGLGVDMATGTGWPFGGPWVPEADANTGIVLENGKLTGKPTGQQVKRAAPGDEGNVLDPYNPDALLRYLSKFDEAFKDLPAGLIRGQFHDSFEYYGASWSPGFEARFKQMHGYDIQDHAGQLMGESEMDEDSLKRLVGDYRATLSAMHLDYLKTWNQWAHEKGMITRNQSHGAPANLLDLYAAADVPETEIFGSTPFPIPGLRRDASAVRSGRSAQDLPEPLVSRFASSAAHVTGKPLVSCESATWLRDHWKVSLAYVKPELDRVMLDGINHIFYHGTVFSPQDVPWPGWLFYASTQFNPSNPWWDDFSSLNGYIERVQSVTQGGVPDSDVLLYWPEADVWHTPPSRGRGGANPMRQLSVHGVDWIMDAPCGQLATAMHKAGYAFDYISDRQVADCVAKDGSIVTSGGGHYTALIVPATQYMPVATMQQLVALAEGGAKIYLQEMPADVPGLGDVEDRRGQLKAAQAKINLQPGPGALKISGHADGGLVVQGDLLDALEYLDVPSEPMVATGADFIRRATANGHDYFVANLTGKPVDGWVELGKEFRSAMLLDPLTGRSGLAAHRNQGNAREIYMQLKPGESLVIRTLSDGEARSERWQYLKASEDKATQIAGTWNVEFIKGGPTLPAAFSTDKYGSWTDMGSEDAKRFSGTARYTIEFQKPEGDAGDWLLDLGDVRESARVRLNGQDVATAWSLPMQVRVGKYLKPGTNKLELEITNVAANRIRDMDQKGVNWKIMREINFVNIDYRPFDASGWEIEPAGLLTPVKLVPMSALKL